MQQQSSLLWPTFSNRLIHVFAVMKKDALQLRLVTAEFIPKNSNNSTEENVIIRNKYCDILFYFRNDELKQIHFIVIVMLFVCWLMPYLLSTDASRL